MEIIHVRRGDTDILPRPDLVLEYGDRLGLVSNPESRAAFIKHFGDSILAEASFSFVALGRCATGRTPSTAGARPQWSPSRRSRRQAERRGRLAGKAGMMCQEMTHTHCKRDSRTGSSVMGTSRDDRHRRRTETCHK
jgi:hypothetical protein